MTSSQLSSGTFQLVFTATDRCGNAATHTFDLTVHNPVRIFSSTVTTIFVSPNCKQISVAYFESLR